MRQLFVFKQISLRIRIFLSMLLLVLVASVLIVGVTIYQYGKETKEYNISRFERKEVNTKKDIWYTLNKEKQISTDSLSNLSLIHI